MFKYSFSVLILLFLTFVWPVDCQALVAPFINEFHYDNYGADTNEGIEIAAEAGVDLLGWSLVLYNGNNGAEYSTLSLTGIISDQQAGFGTLWFSAPGFQNGPADGIALIDPASAVVQFLSYEGSLTALSGPANGLTALDVGISESPAPPENYSLQLTGFGKNYSDFTWSGPLPHTFGSINNQQRFTDQPLVPEPSTLSLLGLGVLGFFIRRKTHHL